MFCNFALKRGHFKGRIPVRIWLKKSEKVGILEVLGGQISSIKPTQLDEEISTKLRLGHEIVYMFLEKFS